MMNDKLTVLIEKLGGFDESYPLSVENVKAVEIAINSKLPDEYETFLLEYGYAMPEQILVFYPEKGSSEYIHDETIGFTNLLFHGSELSYFYGINPESGDNELLDAVETYKDRMPEYFLPIADDGLGNQICISLNKDSFGHVYWWNHENEWDEGNYCKDVGVEMPNKVKFQNIYLIAESFCSFLAKLTISSD